MSDDSNERLPFLRSIIDSDSDPNSLFGIKTTDRELIDAELREFASESENGELDVPWDDLDLEEDDWVLRELFARAGLNPERVGHWRLLLGLLGEFQVGPDSAGKWVRK